MLLLYICIYEYTYMYVYTYALSPYKSTKRFGCGFLEQVTKKEPTGGRQDESTSKPFSRIYVYVYVYIYIYGHFALTSQTGAGYLPRVPVHTLYTVAKQWFFATVFVLSR